MLTPPDAKEIKITTNIVSGTITPSIISSFEAHRSDVHYVEAFGKRYLNVRGRTPYFIQIVELNAIALVTEGQGFDGALHLINLNDHKDVCINGVGTFGENLNSASRPGEPFSDWIKVTPDRKHLLLNSRGARDSSVTTVDLPSKRILGLKVIHGAPPPHEAPSVSDSDHRN